MSLLTYPVGLPPADWAGLGSAQTVSPSHTTPYIESLGDDTLLGRSAVVFKSGMISSNLFWTQHTTGYLSIVFKISASPTQPVLFQYYYDNTWAAYDLILQTDRRMRVGATGGANYAVSTSPIPLDTWVRVDLKMGPGSVHMRVFHDPFSTTPTYNSTDLAVGPPSSSGQGTIGISGYDGVSTFLPSGQTLKVQYLKYSSTDTRSQFTDDYAQDIASADYESSIAPTVYGSNTDTGVAGSLAISNTVKHSGVYSLRTSGTEPLNFVRVGISPSRSFVVYRQYYWIPSTGFTNGLSLANFSSSTNSTQVVVATNGTITLGRRSNTLGTAEPTELQNAVSSAAGAWKFGEWVRVELLIDATSNGGYAILRVWTTTGGGSNATGTPNVELTAVAYTNPIASAQVGYSCLLSGIPYEALTANAYQDNLAIETGPWIGPIVSTERDASITSAVTTDTTISSTTVAPQNESRTVTSAVTTDTTISSTSTAPTVSVTSTSASTTDTTITGDVSTPGANNRTVTSASTTSTTVSASSSPPPVGGATYPGGTKTHPAIYNNDSPSDGVKGGPVLINSIGKEVESISQDLVSARQQGEGFATLSDSIAFLHENGGTHEHLASEVSSTSGTVQSDIDYLGGAIGGLQTSITNHNHSTAAVTGLDAAITGKRLDQFAAPTSDVSLGSRKITNLATPTVGTDAATKAYADSLTNLTPLQVKGTATWSTISGLSTPVAGDLYVLQSADAGAPTRAGGGAAQAGDAIVRTTTATWINSGPFQGPAGTNGTNGTNGSSVFPTWAPNVDYPVGTTVIHEGDIWTLTADDPTNGVRQSVQLRLVETRDIGIFTGVAQSPPVQFQQPLYSDLAVVIVEYKQVGAGSITAPNYTEITSAAVSTTVSGETIGIRMFISNFNNKSAHSEITLNNMKGRITWVSLTGVDKTLGAQYVETSVKTSLANRQAFALSGTLNSAVGLGSGALIAANWYGTADGVLSGKGAPGDANELGSAGSEQSVQTFAIAKGGPVAGGNMTSIIDRNWRPTVFFGQKTATTYDKNYYQAGLDVQVSTGVAATIPVSVVNFLPSSDPNAMSPLFNKNVWQRLSNNGFAEPIELATRTRYEKKIHVPEAGKNYSITLNWSNVGSQPDSTFEITMPKPWSNAKNNDVRIYFKISSERRNISFNWNTRGLDVVRPLGVKYAARHIEPNPEPGSSGFIDLTYDSFMKCWLIVGGSGDLIYIDREPLTNTSRYAYSTPSEVGMMVLTGGLTSTEKNQVRNLMSWIPLEVRRMYGTLGGVQEILKPHYSDAYSNRMADGGSQGDATIGFASSGILQTASTYTATSGPSTAIPGLVILHEFGHLVDSTYNAALGNYTREFAPAPYNSIAGWMPLWETEIGYNAIMNIGDNPGIWSYVTNVAGEWQAEILVTAWVANGLMNNLPGGASYNAFQNQIAGCLGSGDPDNLWPGLEAYFKQWGLISYSGSLPVS